MAAPSPPHHFLVLKKACRTQQIANCFIRTPSMTLNATSFGPQPLDDASSRRIQIAIDTASTGWLALPLERTDEAFEVSLERFSPRKPARKEDTASRAPDWGNVFFNLSAADGAVHIEDMARVADAAMKDAKNRLDAAFSMAGIRNSPPLQLSFDLGGQLCFEAHPQKEQIVSLFKENPELEQTVRTAMCLKENAVSWQKAELYTQMYQTAYGLRGKAAAQTVSAIFLSLGQPRSSFRYDSSGFTALFNGQMEHEYLASVRDALGRWAA